MPLNYDNTCHAVRQINTIIIQMPSGGDDDPVIDSFRDFFVDFENRFERLVNCINDERESIDDVADLDIAGLCRQADNLIAQVGI